MEIREDRNNAYFKGCASYYRVASGTDAKDENLQKPGMLEKAIETAPDDSLESSGSHFEGDFN